ncbi:MFS transporter [Cytobacillus spongiae]|uniref:MFS transporter n=1 Tax=Cytobacillus spongiae TaxID=2901381 RepID=UPI001F471C17|nr:MFS transporter [Cytobacillus spongiae]UII57608.1 MFS transporter [Cytobacillus spongiae]
MNQLNNRKGFLMIAVLWFAYVTFAMNWVAGSSLTPQITNTFFGGPVDPLISQVVNYSITTARVFANILAAVLLMRLGPKKAASLAIGFLMMALVAIYLPNYWGYTLARMVMGLGGSMVIVYMNPVVGRYITNSQLKLRITALNTVSYNVGAFIVSLLFTFFAAQLTQDWKLTMTIFAGITLIIFIAWLFMAENFDTQSTSTGEVVDYGYKDAIRDSFVWKYGLAFSGFLTLYILSLVSLKPVFEQYTELSGSLINLLVSGAGILGTLAGVKIGAKGTPRKKILLFTGVVMIGSFGLTIALGNILPIASYFFAFVSGFAMFIQYPIFMNLPHEMKGMSPHKLTIIFGLFWAIAYATQTIITIAWSAILGSAGYVPSMIFFLAASSLYLVFTAILPETKPKQSIQIKQNVA